MCHACTIHVCIHLCTHPCIIHVLTPVSYMYPPLYHTCTHPCIIHVPTPVSCMYPTLYHTCTHPCIIHGPTTVSYMYPPLYYTCTHPCIIYVPNTVAILTIFFLCDLSYGIVSTRSPNAPLTLPLPLLLSTPPKCTPPHPSFLPLTPPLMIL